MDGNDEDEKDEKELIDDPKETIAPNVPKCTHNYDDGDEVCNLIARILKLHVHEKTI